MTPSGDTGWNKHQSRSLNHSHLTSLNERWSVLPLTSAAEQSDPNSACSSRPFTMKWMIFVVIPEPGGSWPAPQRILRPLDSDSFSLWRTTCSWQTARPFSHLTIIQDNLLNQHTRAAKSQIQTDFKLYYYFIYFSTTDHELDEGENADAPRQTKDTVMLNTINPIKQKSLFCLTEETRWWRLWGQTQSFTNQRVASQQTEETPEAAN